MNIAIIGSGISGLSCAYKLSPKHNITVFEKAERIGGHTATIDVDYQGEHHRIDTGFIVYNDWTYPCFIQLLEELGVESQETEMSFSVSCPHSGLEYSGNNLNTLFAQRRNLLNIPYLAMLYDLIRFNKQAIQDLEAGRISESLTLGDYLDENKYGVMFKHYYLIPMGSAIWSASLNDMLKFPLLFFVRFFKNHGLLNIVNRPQWRVIKGGSASYLKPLTQDFSEKIKLSSQIQSVHRAPDSAVLTFKDGSQSRFDQVVFACHSNQALNLLGDASKSEEDILGSIPYKNNRVTLHTDTSLLPGAKRAWASWNYHVGEDRDKPATLSYNMNILQGIQSDTTFVVTLNDEGSIDQSKIIDNFEYAHPNFTLEGIAAQSRWPDINGHNRTWFCGAYWRNGFHEDGCMTGMRVADSIEKVHS